MGVCIIQVQVHITLRVWTYTYILPHFGKKETRTLGEVSVLTSLLVGVAGCALVSLVRILGKRLGKTMPPLLVSNDKDAT